MGISVEGAFVLGNKVTGDSELGVSVVGEILGLAVGSTVATA